MAKKKFNPETDTPICFMVVSPSGKILSKAPGQGSVKQYACACDVDQGLPKTPLPGQDATHGLTIDPCAVSCPNCQKTPEFLDAYEHQTGKSFEPSV